MSSVPTCGQEAAAYALGALDEPEAEDFRRHLETCAVCRDELATFELVVNALPMAAPQHEPPGGLKRRVMRKVRAEPKPVTGGWRRRLPDLRLSVPAPALALGVGLVAALAVVAGFALSSSGSGTRVVRAQVGQAELRVTGAQGELVVAHLPVPGRGRIYELWLQRGSRQPSPSTLFSVTSGGTAEVGIPGSVTGVSRVLVTSEPAGGSPAPTSQPLIAVTW